LSLPERALALGVRAALYLLIVGFPVSGYLMNTFQGDDVDLYGSTIPALLGTSASRRVLLRMFATSHCRSRFMRQCSPMSARP
jgi:cytochrome b561